MRLRINKRAQFGLVAAASIAATLAAGGLAMAATDTRIASEQLGRFGDADLNNDGKITRPEWLRAAANRFAAIDADGNGSLSQSELPKPPVPPRPGRHHGPDGPPPPGPGTDADAEWGPPPAPVAPAAGSVAAAPVQAAPAAGASVAAPAR